MTYCEHITSHSFLKSLPYRRDNPPPHPNPAAMSRSYFCLFLDYHTAIIGLIGKLHVVAVDEQHPRRWSTGHFQAKKKNKFRFNASWWPHRPQGCRQPLRRWKKSLFYRSDEQMVDICLTRTFFPPGNMLQIDFLPLLSEVCASFRGCDQVEIKSFKSASFEAFLERVQKEAVSRARKQQTLAIIFHFKCWSDASKNGWRFSTAWNSKSEGKTAYLATDPKI